MLVTALVILDGQLVDADEVLRAPLTIRTSPADDARGLLVNVISVEDAAFFVSYVAVVPYALTLNAAGRPVSVDLVQPLTELTPSEQVLLRTTLVHQSWSAWARSPHHVRALLGCPEPPLLLADAARQLNIPLPTLANAAVSERLPTMRAGDRHLVYLTTVSEAQDRGLLHVHRGRPRRGSL